MEDDEQATNGFQKTSLEEQAILTLRPNPTNGELQVTITGSSIEEVIVYDVVGKELMRVSAVHSQQTTINVELLHSGIYFLKIVAEDGIQHTKKIIKR